MDGEVTMEPLITKYLYRKLDQERAEHSRAMKIMNINWQAYLDEKLMSVHFMWAMICLLLVELFVIYR